MTKAASWIADKIERWPIDKLIPYARNARTHSDAQVAQIAASIREFGFTNPVLIDGEGNIIAGHGRVLAARKLGMQEIPCIRLEHLTETQRRAYIIADNKLALNAEWDEELLALELSELQELGFDLDLTGFRFDEIKLPQIDDNDRQESSAKEIDVDEYEMQHKCPRCGFEFNDNGKA
jgi:ParB-like chromosome segregation protein Spo0J